MTNTELEQYFEDLATRFRPIGHKPATPRYCRFNMEEVASGLVHKIDLSDFCLFLEAPTGTLENNNGDGHFDNQEIAFMIIKKVALRDFEGERDTLGDSRRLGQQLLAKIIQERQFADLDENTIAYDKVGPVFTNAFGYRFAFTVVSPAALIIDPADWI